MIFFLLSACATVDQKINLSYIPLASLLGSHNGAVVISRIDSEFRRQSPQGVWIIGSLNNVHGVRQADLLTDRFVGEWVTDALLAELKRAGYSASYATVLPTGVKRGITLTNIRTFLDINTGTVTAETRHELAFTVDIIINGEKRKTLTISSRDNQTVALKASQEEKEQIMLHSLQDAMKKTIPEIIALFSTS
jgi:hypothetical protein